MNVERKAPAFLLLLLLTNCFHLFAQDCSLSVNKYALKNYNKAMDLTGNDEKTITKKIYHLKEAIKVDPYFYSAIWKLTALQMDNPYVSDVTVKEVKENLEFVVTDCPTMHSSPYYFLGEIYMGENNHQKAKEYFEAFVDFSHSSPNKYDKENYYLYKDKAREQLASLSRKQFIEKKKNDVKIQSQGNHIVFEACEGEGSLKMVIQESKVVDQNIGGDDLVLIRGMINGKSDGPILNAQVLVNESNGQKEYSFDVNRIDGSFNALIHANKSTALDFKIIKDGIEVRHYQVSQVTSDVVVKSIDKLTYQPKKITFDGESTTLSLQHKKILDAFAEYMIHNPSMKICIEDYSYEAQDASENKKLSIKRAKALQSYLYTKGIDKTRLYTLGKGDSMTKDPSSRALTNHANFVILNQ